MFKTESKFLQARMERLWDHSIEIAATSHVVAGRAAGYNKETALLAGLLQGITASYDGNDATYADLDAFVRWRFYGETRGIGLVVGYRHFIIEADYEDGGTAADIDLTFNGPYVAFQFSF